MQQINTYKKYEPEEIRRIVSAIEPDDIPELIRAVMVLCDVVNRHDLRIDDLDDAERERHAAAELAESVALDKPA